MVLTLRIENMTRLTVLSFLTLFLAIAPTLAPAADTDLDGFDDSLEKGTPICTIDDPTCQNPIFQFTLKLGAKDLFVILRKATSSASLILGVDPLEYVRSGWNLIVHSIPRDPSTSTRKVFSKTPSQFAMRLTENSTSTLADDNILGVCKYGTPSGLDDATVYTRRIMEVVEQRAAGAVTVCLGTECNPPAAQGWLQKIRDVYVKHTIAHEAGHMMCLTKTYNAGYGGYHYAPGGGTLMDQFVTYTNKDGIVTFHIPTHYHAQLDRPRLRYGAGS